MSPIRGSFSSGGSFGAKGKMAPVGLYDFSEVTFNTPSNYYTGPSLTQIRDNMTGPEVNDWKNDTSFLNVTSGIISWTVPIEGTYRVEAWGARGLSGHAGSSTGGWGSRMRGDFILSEGEIIKILIGQTPNVRGVTGGTNYGGGGGGGTFITKAPHNNDSSILIIAGGGGGGAHGQGPGAPAPHNSSNGNNSTGGTGPNPTGAPGGTSGNGGGGGNQHGGAGGAGFYGNGNGSTSNYYGQAGDSYVNGGRGGYGSVGYIAAPSGWEYGFGGFGGGGGVDHSGGGGGGYSGGGGSYHFYCGGGGGGSWNSGANQNNAQGASGDGRPSSDDNGRVKITFIG